MKKIIINADDFGLTGGINMGIVRAFDAGALKSTSLTVNGRAFTQAVSLAKSRPALQVGLHLCLMEEKPVLSTEDVPSLLDDTGYFYKELNDFLRGYLRGKIKKNEIYKELVAQFELFKSTGIKIDHINSHRHLHILPSILEIVVELALKYEVSFIRVSQEPMFFKNHMSKKRFLNYAVLYFLSYLARKRLKKKGLRTSDIFFGFSCSGDLTSERLKDFLWSDWDGIAEIVCHPGYRDEETSTAYRHWNYNWEKELKTLLKIGAELKLNPEGF